VEDTRTYQIEVMGLMDEQALNASSPLRMRVIRLEPDGELPLEKTRISVLTDQSGLIGLLRYLHARGLVLLSVNWEG
jgi:hypothetical protein